MELDDLTSVGSETVVRVTRSHGDVVAGVVAAVGGKWLLLHLVFDLNLWGVTAVRLSDIRKVKVHQSDDVAVRSLRRRGLLPPAIQGVRFDRTADVLSDLQSSTKLITVYPDRRWPGTCHVGTLTNIDARRKRFCLLELSPSASWDNAETHWRFRDVRRIDIADPYADALAALAGPPPDLEPLM